MLGRSFSAAARLNPMVFGNWLRFTERAPRIMLGAAADFSATCLALSTLGSPRHRMVPLIGESSGASRYVTIFDSGTSSSRKRFPHASGVRFDACCGGETRIHGLHGDRNPTDALHHVVLRFPRKPRQRLLGHRELAEAPALLKQVWG